MAKNRFKNPADGSTYDWHINQAWDGEDDSGVESTYTWASSTGGAALPQFGGLKATIKTLKGTILHLAQHEAFLAWAAIAQNHTIYFRDVDGDEWEVMILKYLPRRQGVARNIMDFANMPYYIYRYELTMVFLGAVAA